MHFSFLFYCHIHQNGANIGTVTKKQVMKNHTLKLERSWDHVKELLKENDYRLTDEDLLYIPGEEDKLLDRLAVKMGITTEEVRILIESISANDRLAF